LRKLSQITAGQNFQIEEISDLAKTFGGVADESGRRYNLGYYPKHSATGQKRQIRQIKVKVRQPNLVIRARSNYFAGIARKIKYNSNYGKS